MVVNVYNQTKYKLPQGQKEIEKILKIAAALAEKFAGWEITVMVTSDRGIRTLNNKYRHQDRVTDVLSFSQKEGSQIVLSKEGQDYLGDIVICYPQIMRQAKKYGQSIKKEFGLMLIHGFLHLVGYDDQTKAAWQKMEKIQNKIFLKIYG
jgi:probable rRNA maturation factor